MVELIRYVLEEIKENGFIHCIKQLWKRTYYACCQVIGLFAYPVCLLTNTKFLNVNIEFIGHLTVETDCFIKEGLLGLRPNYNAILLAPHRRVANIHLISYWKKYLRIITNPILCILLDPLSKCKLTTFDITRYFVATHGNVDYTMIQKQYGNRPPLLTIDASDYERGWNTLEKLGIPRNAWFVCVHVRENGKNTIVHNQQYRNADINNYFLAIETIIEKGGWIIRMGDPTMKPISKKDHVIDYAHLNIKSDWMDIFLCTNCKFFLGSQSGLVDLSAIFGVPAGITNGGVLEAILPYGTSSISIPKLIYSYKENRILTFKEVFDSPISQYHNDKLYLKSGVKPTENTPEDIRDLALEILDIANGSISYTSKDEQLQNRFKSMLHSNHYSYGAISKVGRDFLRKYSHLFGDNKHNEEP